MPTRNASSAATAFDRLLNRRWVPPTAGSISGLLLSASFPPADAGLLAFVALIPLFLVVSRARLKESALAAGTFGIAFFGSLLYWIRLFGIPAYVALVVLETVLAGLAIMFATFLRPRAPGGMAWLVLPAAFVCGEFLRSAVPFGGFTWGGLGYTQHDNLHLLRLVSFTGSWGLSFVVALVNSVAADWVVNRRSMRHIAVPAAVAAIALLLPLVLPAGDADGDAARIAMIQADAPEGTFDPITDDRIVFENHLRLTRSLAGDVDLVIWPESAFDTNPFEEPSYRKPMEQTIRDAGAPFLIGATVVATERPELQLQNVSFFVDERARLMDTYVKRRLVPFGEFVPFRPVLEPIFNELSRVPYDLVPGNRATTFQIDGGRFASVICFESTFPSSVRSFVRAGARFLVVSTNNSSFGRTAASDQHVIFSQMRAAEHHMWVAHTALTGVSAVVRPDGQVVARSGLFEEATFTPRIRFSEGPTFYGRYGDWFPWMLVVLVVLLGVSTLRRRRSRHLPPPKEEPSGGTLVVIPTYNEAENIENVLSAIRSVLPSSHVLVVDDDSPDGTGAIVARMRDSTSGIHLLTRSGKQGLGRAYVAGFGWGLARDYDRFVEMDADLSHDPADLVRLVAAAEGSDLVIGSRYVKDGKVVGWGRGRHMLSRMGNLYSRVLLGFNVQDATSGFRCYRREVLDSIGLENILSDGYAFQIDMAYRAWALGFKVTEVPITFRERRTGESKMSRAIVAEAIGLVTFWGLRDRLFGRARMRNKRGRARVG